MADMDKPTNSLFEVFLRLRPPVANAEPERFLDVEGREDGGLPTHITIKPPANDHRKRAVERFAFTRVFEEGIGQLDVFDGAGVLPLVEGVLSEGRDGLLATLGVTGSGKSHTILGTKSQRGLTQLALDVLYQSLSDNLVHPTNLTSVFNSITNSDVSEAQILPASTFLNSVYGDNGSGRGSCSRANTPMPVNTPFHSSSTKVLPNKSPMPGMYPASPSPRVSTSSKSSTRAAFTQHVRSMLSPKPKGPTSIPSVFERLTRNQAKQSLQKETSFMSLPGSSKHRMPRPSALPQSPVLEGVNLEVDRSSEYVIVLSMFEVYNDRIFDLLTGTCATNGPKMSAPKRRALLFKSTELSPDRKVVAGLRKVVCSSLEEALTVLETGLIERRVAGTGSNAVSSRSHGFFCFEVKKRNRIQQGPWSSSTLTVVDLAGSERARQAKTAGATLAEAGKINESLMYLGQCMQMQSDNQEGNKQNIVPFRQCKLTELLFSNSFPSPSVTAHHHHYHYSHKNPQKAIMIVTANPTGDFNATSQILRYSALAREVTVPRIPSVTSQVFGNGGLPMSSGRTTPSLSQEDLELALREAARLAEERDILALELEEERSRREAAEASWSASEQRMQEMEAEVREECYADFEARLDQERRRWRSAWEEEADRNDEHMDKKIDLFSKQIDADFEIHEDVDQAQDERVLELEDENAALKAKIERMEREILQRSPTKILKTPKTQRVLKAKKWQGEENDVFASP